MKTWIGKHVNCLYGQWIEIIFKWNDDYPTASKASWGVYWNQAQKNFSHPYTEYPWVSVMFNMYVDFHQPCTGQNAQQVWIRGHS